MSAIAISNKSNTQPANLNALNLYVRDTKRFPILKDEEVHELALRVVEGGDSDAARRLVESNLRLVVKIAYEYQRAHTNLLDLVQEGNIGLIRAVSKYDPLRGVKLSSYASYWIRAYILKFVVSNHRLVKLGTTQAQRKLFFNLKKERDRLESEGFSADSESLAKALDVRERDVIDMQKRLRSPDASFDAPLAANDEDGSRTRYDVIESDRSERPDEAVEKREFHALLKSKIDSFADTLDGREERIFRQRWLADEPVTLRELGAEFGVTRERTRQIEKRLLVRVKDYLTAELGAAVDIGESERSMAA